jgi:hypothetical protein
MNASKEQTMNRTQRYAVKPSLTLLITLLSAPLAQLDAAETVAIPDAWRGSAGQGKVSTTAGIIAVERDSTAAKEFAAVADAQTLGEGFYVFSGKARTAAEANGAAAILARKALDESLREWKTPQLDAGGPEWRDFSVRLFAPKETAKFEVILRSSAGKVEFKDLKLEKTTWLEGRATTAPKLEFWINMDYYDNVIYCKGLGLEGYGEAEIAAYFKTCREKGVTGVQWRVSIGGQMQYPSKVATPFPGRVEMEQLGPDQARFAKTLTEIDPLSIAVREAKKNGIEVYIWLTLIDEGYNHPSIGGYLFSDFQLDHPHTMLLNRKGDPLKGTICYNEPEAFAYRINIVKELLSYGADGLYLCNRTHNWSFGRDNGDEYGFNPAVAAEYKKRYGTDILTQDFHLEKWRGIRAGAYDRLIEEIARLAHADGQKVRLGVGNTALSGGPMGPNWGNLRVDWRRYLREGWVDSMVSGQDKLQPYLAGAEMNQFRRAAKPDQKFYFWAEMNNWKDGGMYPPEDLLRQAEAFAFFGANGGIHQESLNLESANGMMKYFAPLTQFYRTLKTTETREK